MDFHYFYSVKVVKTPTDVVNPLCNPSEPWVYEWPSFRDGVANRDHKISLRHLLTNLIFPSNIMIIKKSCICFFRVELSRDPRDYPPGMHFHECVKAVNMSLHLECEGVNLSVKEACRLRDTYKNLVVKRLIVIYDISDTLVMKVNQPRLH